MSLFTSKSSKFETAKDLHAKDIFFKFTLPTKNCFIAFFNDSMLLGSTSRPISGLGTK